VTLLIGLPGSEDHVRGLAASLELEVMVPELRQFPDGELYVRLDRSSVSDQVVILGNLDHHNFLRIAFLAGTARDLGARRVGLVAPYLAYMRQDSRFHRGEGVTASYFARLVSSTVDWMVTVDPHLHRLHALDAVYTIPTSIAGAASAIARWIQEHIEHPLLVGPDAESVQWVSAVARHCDAPFLILEKTRRGDRDVSVSSPAAGRIEKHHTPVLIDDIVSTGRTMIEATRQLCAAGTAPPVCVAIHAVFADAVHDDLIAAGARRLVTCDTIRHVTTQISVTDALAAAARERL
jgi:ribose-phosphate pyrophosphokinase